MVTITARDLIYTLPVGRVSHRHKGGRMNTLKFVVVLFQEEGGWVSQCLNYDVAAQGDTIAEAREALAQTLAEHIVLAVHHGEQPFAGIPPAPIEYWAKFRDAERLADIQPIFVPAAYMINAMADDVRVSA